MAQVTTDQMTEKWHSRFGAATDSVETLLRPFQRRAAVLRGTSLFIVAIMALAVLLIAAMWFDLIWSLPPLVRWSVSRGGMFIVFLVALVIGWRQSRRWTAERLSWQIDQQAATGGVLLTGLQLETRSLTSNHPVTRAFALQATRDAGKRLAQIRPDEVLSSSIVRRRLKQFAFFVAGIAVLTIAVPAVAWNQSQRFLWPWADVPPFTGTVLELEPMETTVRYGDDVQLNVFVRQGQVDQIRLMIEDARGTIRQLPMVPQTSESWQAVLTRVTEPLTVFAASGRSRSHRGRILVQMTPEIRSSEVMIESPAYTRKAIYAGPIPANGIAGVKGTIVRWKLTSNRPLRQGTVRLKFDDGTVAQQPLDAVASSDASTDVDRVSLSGNGTNSDVASSSDRVHQSQCVVGRIELSKPGQFELSVTDTDGVESLDRITGRIQLVPDRRPVVRILEPRPMSLATPDTKLPVVVAAEDDFGLSRMDLYRSLNGSTPSGMSLDINDESRQQVRWELDLPRYQVQPGDEIRLFARAEDNDPDGAKGSESPVTVIKIVSTQAMQKMLLQQKGAESIQAKYQAARRNMEQVAEALRRVDEAAKKAAAQPQVTDAARELQEALQAAQAAASEAAKEMNRLAQQPMPLDIDERLAKELEGMAKEMEDAAKSLQQMASQQAESLAANATNPDGSTPSSPPPPGSSPGLSPAQQQELQKLMNQLSGNREQLEQQAIAPLNKLQQAMPLIAAQQSFVQLANQQRDLAERMQALAGEDSDSAATQRRMAELEAEQQQLRDGLSNLLTQIEDQAKGLPNDPDFEKLKESAQQFAQAVRSSGAPPAMANAQQELLKDQFKAAAEQAQGAAEELENFISQCNSMGDSACSSCEMAFSPGRGGLGLGDTMQQLKQMMSMKTGGRPGSGFGWGAGNGFAQRIPGPQNMGLYSNMSLSSPRTGGGKSDRVSQGVSSTSLGEKNASEDSDTPMASEGHSAGQGEASVPSIYRARVADYFERLTEQLGEQP